MEEKLGDRAGSGDRLRAADEEGPTRSRSSTSTARSGSRSRSPTTWPALERAIRQTTVNGSTSLYNAIYVSLKGLKTERARSAEEIRRQAIVVLSDGDDTSSLVDYDEVLDLAKRSETAIYAIGLRQPDDRAVEVQGSGVRAAAALGGNRRPRVLPDARSDELPKIYEQISEELSSQYSLAYTSKNPLRNGAWRRIVVRVTQAGADRANPAGILRPEEHRTVAAPCISFRSSCTPRRRPRTSRTSPGAIRASGAWRRRRSARGVLAHTFLIGMQTVQAGHAPLVGTSAAISAFVWLLGLSYLYVELTSDERSMGVFVAIAARRARRDSGARSGRLARGRRCCSSPLFIGPRPLAALRVRQLRARLRARRDLRPALHGDQGEAARASSTPGCRRCRRST